MNGETAFKLWSIAAGRWAQWVKPSLFSGVPHLRIEPASTWPANDFLPPAGDTALVLDLYGAAAIPLAVALSRRGYCPVPMYNTTSDSRELVGTTAIVETLVSSAEAVVVNASGPPVFLIDHFRSKAARGEVGDYDNRWRLFPSDFPSVKKLQELGVNRLVIVTPRLDDDLHDALANHLALQPTLLDPDTKQSTPMPKPAHAFWRGVSSFLDGLGRPVGGAGPFGHRIRSSGG